MTYNCSHLSTEIWNALANTNWSMSWNRSPRFVIKDIKESYSDYEGSNYVETSDWYGFYDTSSNMMKTFNA